VSSSFTAPKFYDLKFKLFDVGSSQLFDFWQSEYCEILTCILVPNSSCYISTNLYVTYIKLLDSQTSIFIFHGAKVDDVKCKRFDMGASQLFDFWQSEYCEKLTCILFNIFKLLYLRKFIGDLHQAFRPADQCHHLSRHQILWCDI
jgi:hypothetical protein